MKQTLPEVYLDRNKIYRHTEITVQKLSLMSTTLHACYAFIHCVWHAIMFRIQSPTHSALYYLYQVSDTKSNTSAVLTCMMVSLYVHNVRALVVSFTSTKYSVSVG